MVTIEAHWVPLGPIASPLTIFTHTQTQTRTGTHTHTVMTFLGWPATYLTSARRYVCVHAGGHRTDALLTAA